MRLLTIFTRWSAGINLIIILLYLFVAGILYLFEYIAYNLNHLNTFMYIIIWIAIYFSIFSILNRLLLTVSIVISEIVLQNKVFITISKILTIIALTIPLIMYWLNLADFSWETLSHKRINEIVFTLVFANGLYIPFMISKKIKELKEDNINPLHSLLPEQFEQIRHDTKKATFWLLLLFGFMIYRFIVVGINAESVILTALISMSLIALLFFYVIISKMRSNRKQINFVAIDVLKEILVTGLGLFTLYLFVIKGIYGIYLVFKSFDWLTLIISLVIIFVSYKLASSVANIQDALKLFSKKGRL